MNIFKFALNAGEKMANAGKDMGAAVATQVKKHLPGAKDLKVAEKNGRVVLEGTVKTREEAEKAVLAAGNNEGVEEVESRLIVEEISESVFYTVKSGDTLSAIAKTYYGNAMRYPEIFEANKPMLSDPDKIYPGQVLRIPGAEKPNA